MTTFSSVFEPTRLPLSFTSRHVVGGRRGVGLSRPAALVPVVRAVDGRTTLNGHVATTKQEMMGSAKGGVGVEEKKKSTVANDFGHSQSDSDSTAVADLGDVSVTRKKKIAMSDVGNSTNIVWHDCPVSKLERQKLLGQKGCVLWITGLSGSGKSTLASALSRELYLRGFLSYVLDGDNLRHGLNNDLSFKAEHRVENIRRTGEVAKLFADTGVICIASLISPYRRDRDACRELLQPDGNFIEVFMDMPLEVCEARDPKGLYKLARAGKIKGFTGIDDPYEPPLYSEIVIQRKYDACPSPTAMAEEVIAYLEKEGYLKP